MTGNKEIKEITFSDGRKLKVGDVFYFVPPREYIKQYTKLYGVVIHKCTVDSFWQNDPCYGYEIRFTVEYKSTWVFVWQRYFESENPTCFLELVEAQKAADERNADN